MGLCIPETWNLWFRSWSIPERDNSPKGSRASKAHGALHNSSKGTSSQDSWGFASLKLGISDSIVEVSLKGTIRLREQVPGYRGKSIQFNRTDGGILFFACNHLCKIFATCSFDLFSDIFLHFFDGQEKNGADGCFESDGKTNRSFLIQ